MSNIQKVREFYNSTKLSSDIEPTNINLHFVDYFGEEHAEILQDAERLVPMLGKVSEIVCPIFGKNLVQDGFKFSTTTWIWLGRSGKDAIVCNYRGYLIVARDALLGKNKGYTNAEYLSMAVPVNDDGTVNWFAEIGPCYSIMELRSYIDQEVDALS